MVPYCIVGEFVNTKEWIYAYLWAGCFNTSGK